MAWTYRDQIPYAGDSMIMMSSVLTVHPDPTLEMMVSVLKLTHSAKHIARTMGHALCAMRAMT